MWPTYPLTSYFSAFPLPHAFILLKMATMHNMHTTAEIISKELLLFMLKKTMENRKQKANVRLYTTSAN